MTPDQDAAVREQTELSDSVARDIFLTSMFGEEWIDDTYGQVAGRIRFWTTLPECNSYDDGLDAGITVAGKEYFLMLSRAAIRALRQRPAEPAVPHPGAATPAMGAVDLGEIERLIDDLCSAVYQAGWDAMRKPWPIQHERNILLTAIRTALATAGDQAGVAEDLEQLRKRNLELNLLAMQWMECHDKLKAGEPYQLPRPVAAQQSAPLRQEDAGAGLRAALEPFAAAYKRLMRFGGEPGVGAALYASRRGDTLYELLDGLEGKPLRFEHLRAADEAISVFPTPPADKAVAAVGGREGWQPIETAPKDGTKVDLWVEPHDAFANGNAGRIADAAYRYGDWHRLVAPDLHALVEECGTPTHWMRVSPPHPDDGSVKGQDQGGGRG